MPNLESTINLVSWNVQSLANKIHVVLQLLNDQNIDISCLQETWFSSETNITTSIIKESGYNISHTFRSNKRGGGVAILWKSKLESLKRNCNVVPKTYSSFEYQCVVFNFKTKVIIISLYRLQEVSFAEFLIDLENLINEHFSLSHSILLVGDFNVHFEKTESRDTVLLSDLLSLF